MNLERWKINLYILWFSQLLAMMSFSFGMPFISYFIQELGITDPDSIKIYTAVSTASTAVAMGIAAPVWGMLADRYGRKLMILRSIIMGALILFGISISSNVHQLIILRICQGLFAGTVAASGAFVASDTPDGDLSYSLGILTSASFIGMMAGPALGGIIAEGLGYRTSFLLGSMMLFVNAVIIFAFLKEKKTAEDKGKIAWTRMVPLTKEIFTPPVISILSIFACLVMARVIFNPYIALYIQEIRATIEGSSKVTGLISGFAAMMTAFSGIAAGKLGIRYDKLKLMKLSLISGTAVAICVYLSRGILAFALSYGMLMLFIGGIEPILLSIASRYVPNERRGGLFGFVAMIRSFGWTVSSLIGSFISINYSLNAIMAVTPVLLCATLVLRRIYVRKYGGM